MDLPPFHVSAPLPAVAYAALTIALVYVTSAWYRARSRVNQLRTMGLVGAFFFSRRVLVPPILMTLPSQCPNGAGSLVIFSFCKNTFANTHPTSSCRLPSPTWPATSPRRTCSTSIRGPFRSRSCASANQGPRTRHRLSSIYPRVTSTGACSIRSQAGRTCSL